MKGNMRFTLDYIFRYLSSEWRPKALYTAREGIFQEDEGVDMVA